MQNNLVFDTESAWGKYRPTGISALLLNLCWRLPPGSARYFKIGQLLRGPLKRAAPAMFDVPFESLKIRLVNRGNYCERRAMTLPQYYDREERDWLCAKLENGGVFLDIGGNVGLFSLTVAGRLRERVDVYTVEPDPHMYERMLYNAGQNNLNITLATVALSDYAGEGKLQLEPRQRGKNALVNKDDNDDIITVRVMTMLALCQEWNLEQVTAMKIDVEGHEHKILSHFMANADEALWPKALVIEHVHGANSIVDILQDQYGYRIESQTKLNLLLSRD